MKKGGVSEINSFISMTNTSQNRSPGMKSSAVQRNTRGSTNSTAKIKLSTESKNTRNKILSEDKTKSGKVSDLILRTETRTNYQRHDRVNNRVDILPEKPNEKPPLVKTSLFSRGSTLTAKGQKNEKSTRLEGGRNTTTAMTNQTKPKESRILTQRTATDDVYRKSGIFLSRTRPINSVTTISDVVSSDIEKKLPSKQLREKIDVDDDLDYEYEDDFEDYESDFELYSPSAESSSDVDDEEPQNTKIFLEEEKKMDSGSYHVTYQQQTPKQIKQLAIIREALHKENKLVQQSIELESSFDFPVTNEINFTSKQFEKPSDLLLDFDVSSMKNFTNMKKRHRDSKIFRKMKIRGEKLLQMVTLDTMSFTLFDSPSIPYDIFMKSYARKNTVQVFTQTNEDDVCVEMQTEEIFYESKWTQHPIKITKNQLSDDVNPFELLSGVGGTSKCTNIRQPEIKIQKLINFMKCVGEEMIAFLEEELSGDDLYGENDGDGINTLFDTVIGECVFHAKCNSFAFLNRYSTIKLQYDRNNASRILSVHKEINNETIINREIYVICIWNIRQPSTPKFILRGYGRLSCCSFVGDDGNFIVAGNEDGSIYIWNLREESNSLYADKVTLPKDEISVILPCYTTIEMPALGTHNSRILNIEEIKITKQNDPYNYSKLRTIYSMDDENTLIVWTLASNFQIRDDLRINSISGDKPRFFSNQTIDMARKIRGFSFSSTISKSLSDCDILIGTDIGIVVRCNLYGKKSRIFDYSQSEEKLRVTGVEVCPYSREYFAVGYDNGVVNLFNVHFTKCIRSVRNYDSFSTGISRVQWLWNEPDCILTFDYSSAINIYRVNSQYSSLIKRITTSGIKAVDVSPIVDSNLSSKTLHFALIIENNIQIHKLKNLQVDTSTNS